MNVSLPNNWAPRAYQRPLWAYLSNGGKRAVANWHRRAGKDDIFLHHTAVAAHERVGNYWYMLPEYNQARKSMWDAIDPHTGVRRIDEAFPKELRKRYSEQEMMIGFHSGSTFQLVGSDNFNSLVGSPPIGLIFSEYALSNPSAWAYLMPILEENGGWAGFNGTPRGNNHYKNLCKLAAVEKGWFYEELQASKTGVFTEEQLQAILRQMQAVHGDAFGKSLWLQEYFCSFDAAIPGSFWGDCLDLLQTRGSITKVEVQPKFPVFTAWDLGFTDDTAIWFYQIFPREIHIFDYHYSTGKSVEFYGDLLRQKAKAGKFQYETHWLPHDARARTLAAGGKSIQMQMNDQKVGRIAIARRLDHQEGIQAARATFPYCWFDASSCEQGLEALRNYHREWDEERQTFKHTPEHDWSSHASSAFRTLALSWKRPQGTTIETPLIEQLLKQNPGARTFAQVRDSHLRRKRLERTLN